MSPESNVVSHAIVPERAKVPEPETRKDGSSDRPDHARIRDLQSTAGNQATAQLLGEGQQKGPDDPVVRDNQKLAERIARIDAFKADRAVEIGMCNYVECLTTGRDHLAIFYLNFVLDELDRVHAFEIPFYLHNHWWSQGGQAIAAEADRRTQEIHLWSKMTQLQAMKASNQNDPTKGPDDRGSGISLEGSLGGWLFDGLDWGMKSKTSRAKDHQWTAVSARFVSHTGGQRPQAGSPGPGKEPAVVHAHVLMGIPANSVLYGTEWEKVKDKLENKTVSRLVIHRYVMTDIRGNVKEHDTQEISGLTEWEKFFAEGKREDDMTSTLNVVLGSVKVGGINRPVVARLALYMNDYDWRTMRYFTVPSEKTREGTQKYHDEFGAGLREMYEPGLGPDEAKKGPDLGRPRALSPLYSSTADLPKGTDPELGTREMLGVQNLVQTGQMVALEEYEKELWAEAERLKEAYRARLEVAAKGMPA